MHLSLEYHPADILGLNALQIATLSADPFPRGLSSPVVARRFDSIRHPSDPLHPDDRARLLDQWESQLAGLEPPVAALDALRSLREPRSSVVLVESLPGILGGPLANLYRAIHAVRLARDLRIHFGEVVVPVLWILADEHEPARVRQQAFLNENLDLRRLSFSGIETSDQPFSRIRFDEEKQRLSASRELLRDLLWEGTHTESALSLFFPRHADTFASSFGRAMSDTLGHLGLVVLVPEWIREDLSRALAHLVSLDLRHALDDSRDAVPVNYASSLGAEIPSLLYHVNKGGRALLLPGGDGYRYEGESGSRTPSELAAEIIQAPTEWSAGPLLRPLCQDSVLPIAARVGGLESLVPEVLNGSLRLVAGLPQTPFVSRLSASLVEPECGRALARLGIGVEAVLSGSLGGSPRTCGAETDSIVALLDQIGATTASELLAARQALAEVDAGLAVQLKRTARQVRALIGDLARRAKRSGGNRRGKERRHVRRLLNSLLPDGLPQEEVLGIQAFIARFGRDWIDELLGLIDPFPTEHLVVRFEETPQPDRATGLRV
jgi:bacillithiol synthase